MKAGNTLNDPHVSESNSIATVLHTLFYISYTLRLSNNFTNKSYGPIAIAK